MTSFGCALEMFTLQSRTYTTTTALFVGILYRCHGKSMPRLTEILIRHPRGSIFPYHDAREVARVSVTWGNLGIIWGSGVFCISSY